MYTSRPKKNQPVRNVRPKIGRNKPCPCGSGKKWKHCHLPIAQGKEIRHVEEDAGDGVRE